MPIARNGSTRPRAESRKCAYHSSASFSTAQSSARWFARIRAFAATYDSIV